MATSQQSNSYEQSIADVIKFLERLEGLLTDVNVKLKTLDKKGEKVDTSDIEMNKLWVKKHVESTEMNKKITKLGDRVEKPRICRQFRKR
jgi:hypothetical protein